MALIQKINPVGVDEVIDMYQTYLWGKMSFNNWQMLPRVYTNETTDGLIAEYYEGDVDYSGVFYDDTFNISSFFFRSSNIEPVDGYFECNISLIFQCDLDSLYPSINHRADEEFNNSILRYSYNFKARREFEFINAQFGIDDVYREFKRDQIKYSDMQERYVCRYNFRARYEISCV